MTKQFPERAWVLLAIGLAAGLCVVSLSQRMLLLIDSPYDIFIPLDAGLRWLQGIWPSRDYPSPIGPLYAILHGLMLSIDSTDARSITRADMIILWFSYLLLWPNLSGLPGWIKAVVLLLLAGMLLSPLQLDWGWRSYRYIADYNRWSWAFYAVVLSWACNPAADSRWARLAVGVALCCLFYLKLTLFIGAVLTAALRLLWRPQARDYLLPAMILLIAILIGLAAGLVLPYLLDNFATGRATGTLRLGKLMMQALMPFNVLSTCLALAMLTLRGTALRLRLFIFASTLLLHVSDLQNLDMMVPLIGLPLLLLMPVLGTARRGWFSPALAAAIAVIQLVYVFVPAAYALIVQDRVAADVEAQPMGAPGTLGERLLISTQSSSDLGTGGGNVPYADDIILHALTAARALTAGLPAGSRIASLEWVNVSVIDWPHLRPARGELLWYDYGRTFTEAIFPPAGRIFAGADAILVPRQFTTRSPMRLVPLYQSWLDRCARLIGSNEQWALYQPLVPGDGVEPPASPVVSAQPLDADCRPLARP